MYLQCCYSVRLLDCDVRLITLHVEIAWRQVVVINYVGLTEGVRRIRSVVGMLVSVSLMSA